MSAEEMARGAAVRESGEERSVTYAGLLERSACFLERAGVPEPEVDARALLFHFFDLDLTGYLLERDQAAPRGEKRELFERAVSMRARRVPLQHILGKAWFMGLPFAVSGDVLIPRPETEILAETALVYLRERLEENGRGRVTSVLDVGTGSGCLAIFLKKALPLLACTGCDISEKALETARQNARALDAEVTFVHADLFGAFPEEQRFDLIVSNPPYIPSGEIAALEPEVRIYDPRSALDGGADGLAFYRRICREAPAHLKKGGQLCVEIGADQGQAVRELFEEAGFDRVTVGRDLAGRSRTVCGRRGQELYV